MNCFIFQYKYTRRKDCPICKTKYSRLQSLQLVIQGQQWSKIIFLFFTALKNQTCLFILKKNTFLLLWFPLTAFSPSDNFAVLNTHTLFRRKILQNYWYSNLTIKTSRNQNITNEAEWRRRNVRTHMWIIVWNFQIALLETLMLEPEHQQSKLGNYKLVCCMFSCWSTQEFIFSSDFLHIILLWIVWAHLGLLKYCFGFGREVITDWYLICISLLNSTSTCLLCF